MRASKITKIFTPKEVSKEVSQETLLSAFSKIKEISYKHNIISLERFFRSFEDIAASPLSHLDIAILGQFKAGKSSFINSLLGERLLPVGVVPVTNIITRLQYSEKAHAVVHFSESQAIIELAELDAFVSELKNPSNQKKVVAVDVFTPLLKEFPNLRFVDTPGIGSVFASHQETTKQWMPEVGVAIFAISVERPLSESDVEAIKELKELTPRIVIVFTKADILVDEQERQSILAFAEATLKQKLRESYPIYFYSARWEEAIWRQQIKENVLFNVAQNAPTEKEALLVHKLASLIKRCLSYLSVALAAAGLSRTQREALQEQILSERLDVEGIKYGLSLLTRQIQKQTRPLIAGVLEERLSATSAQVRNNMLAAFPHWQGNLWQLTRKYEEWLTEEMSEQMLRVSEEEHAKFFGTLKMAHNEISRLVDSFHALLEESVRSVLGVEFVTIEWKLAINEPPQPDIKIERIFDYHLDLLWFLIPMSIFRPLFERHFLASVHNITRVNLSRLAFHWEMALNDAISQMKVKAIEHITKEKETIVTLLSHLSDNTDEIVADMECLKSIAEKLQGNPTRY